VDDCGNGDDVFLDAINDSIAIDETLSQRWIFEFRNNPTS
jgi:hypothetical protein